MLYQEGMIDQDTRDILKADDYLTPCLRQPRGRRQPVHRLFQDAAPGPVAAFAEELPARLRLAADRRADASIFRSPAAPIHINQYVVSKGEDAERGLLLVSVARTRDRR